MADSKLCYTEDHSNSDLVQCGICFAVIDEPKALPCLHTFCFNCLMSWSESSTKKNPDKYTDNISCPSCREDFPLPKGGVKELKTNFFVNKLKERNSMQKKLHDKDAKIPCTSCESSGNTAVGRCVECDDFLCTKCVDSHKSLRILKTHHVLTLEDLRAGKLTMHNLPDQEMCQIHPGEVLRFYCETCDEPMCRDCTVVDHPRPDHKQINLKAAAGDRNEKLQELFKQTEQIPKAIEDAIAEDEQTLSDLEANTQKTIEDYKETVKKAESEFIQKVNELEVTRRKQIEAHRDSLQFQNARLRTALEMTKQVTQNGSEHDVATMYSSLSDTMQQLCKVKPKGIRKTIGKVEFASNKDFNGGMNFLGVLQTFEQWTLAKTIASLQFSSGRGIAFDANSDIAVSIYKGKSIKVYDNNGSNKGAIKTSNQGGADSRGRSYPWGIAISQDGSFFLTDYNPNVKVFDAQRNFKHKFNVQNPNGNTSDIEGSTLYGLAIDAKDRVYVGSSNYYISIHKPDGTRLSGFNVPGIYPYFIAVTPDDNIIVSDHGGATYAVHMYDTDGQQLHTFATPPGCTPGSTFYPTGVCVVQDEVFVASYAAVPAVYRYSLTGDFIDLLTKDVKSPWGIALKDDGEELIVCDNDCINVFHLK